MRWFGGTGTARPSASTRQPPRGGSLLERDHYEILGDAGHGWNVLTLVEDRDSAVAEARGRFEEGRFVAVRVVRSTYDAESNEFHEREALYLGERRRPAGGGPVHEDIGPLCTRVEHIFTAQARRTIRRLLGDWLGRNQIAVVELLHHPDYHQRLEGAGLLLQSAVQRVARAQAGAAGGDVQKRLQQLFLLTDDLSLQIRRMWREDRVVPLAGDDLAGLSAALTGADRRLLFNIAITADIRPITSIGGKLRRLLHLLAATRADHAVALLDGYLAAYLEESQAVAELLGSQPSLGTAVLQLLDMLSGKAPPAADPGVDRLCQGVWLDDLPRCRDTLVRRVVASLRGPRPLAEHDVDAEMAVHRAVLARLEAATADSRWADEVREALAARCERLISPSGLARLLDGKRRPEARFRLLLRLAPGMAGDANRLRLGDLMLSELIQDRVEYELVGRQGSPIERMCELGNLQRLVDASNLLPAHRGAIAERLDGFCCELIRGSRLFEKLAGRTDDPVDKAVAILRLCRRGAFTDGEAMEMARRRVRAHLMELGGADRLARGETDPEKRRRLLALRELLATAGMDDALD